jgi:murein DD-endopeptidase MepM/ murein hydrolase activator NlpD
MRGRFTVILLPSDHRSPRQVSLTPLRCLVSLLLLATATLAVPSLRSAAAVAELRSAWAASTFRSTSMGRDSLRDGIAILASASQPLVTELDKIEALLRPALSRSTERGGKPDGFGDRIFSPLRRHEVTELGKLIALRSTLENSTALLLEAGTALRNLRETTGELPLLWPLRGGVGHVSMLFGYNPNPFTGIPYLHLGLDLGTYRTGDPIVAGADGIVLAAFYDIYSGFGNNVIIRHGHGFYTRYAHLQSFAVRQGKKVRQGDIIGFLGGTGRVDAPHLHYEIRLGPEVLDPLPFIVFKIPPRRLSATSQDPARAAKVGYSSATAPAAPPPSR